MNRLHTIDEAREALGGISRSVIYSLINSGELASINIGRRRFVPDSAIADFIASKVDAA
ncbi:helix-turn-helix domain-containing protein [Hoyosella sp. G463]|uniref:Helix-turn-helix domain-containing protein n=1 Tax=Lolliginicoccus lacisalsi TaxID=2742202 RepID=A0A927JA65_9ACTN|nr:helix-turn-helix domain-containing protein [Lolliginicoccus lacisalsi]MBD8505523.1 helix-turn-helix domain-containing protein [Lolliginicoccus lacisalsi]